MLCRHPFIALLLVATSLPCFGVTVAYWNIPEVDDVTLTDLTGNGHTLVGASTPFNQSGVNVAPNPVSNPNSPDYSANGSIYMNGIGEAAHTNSATAFQMTSTSSFTMEGWVRANAGSSTQYIASDRHEGNSYRGWFINILSDNRLQFYSNSGGTATTAVSSAAIADGTSHHFAAVWDHLSGEMSLYVDGVMQGSPQSHGVGSYTAYGFSIGGRDGSGGGSNFTSDILDAGNRLDELRFSDQALSSSEFLNAIPEPSSALLASLGALALLRRRRH